MFDLKTQIKKISYSIIVSLLAPIFSLPFICFINFIFFECSPSGVPFHNYSQIQKVFYELNWCFRLTVFWFFLSIGYGIISLPVIGVMNFYLLEWKNKIKISWWIFIFTSFLLSGLAYAIVFWIIIKLIGPIGWT